MKLLIFITFLVAFLLFFAAVAAATKDETSESSSLNKVADTLSKDIIAEYANVKN